MNIGSLIRGLLGDAKPGEARQLEMKTGQVVRGMVLSVSEDGQEAVVQIQGVKVRAVLETPLQAGQATLLQVQPPTAGGMTVLKPLSDSPYSSLPSKSVADVLNALGLADTDDNRAMIQAMQASGVPLTKENAELFSRMLQQKPASVPVAEWVQAAAIALQRGLPVTGESVRGLQQAVFGPPVHELLAALETRLEEALAASGQAKPAAGPAAGDGHQAASAAASDGIFAPAEAKEGTNPASQAKGTAAGLENGGTAAVKAGAAEGDPGLPPLLAKLQQVLGQLRAAPALASLQGGAAGSAGAPATEMAPPQESAAPMGSGSQAAPEQPKTHGAEPWVGRILKLLGAEHEQQGVRGAMPPAQTAAAAQGARPGAAAPAIGQGAAPEAGPAGPGPATGGGAAGAAAVKPPASASAGGAGLQPPAADASAPAVQGQQARPAAAGVHPPAAAQVPALEAAGTRAEHALQGAGTQQDTLKGVLLQLLSHDDTPPQLKEAAQQLVSHLTGQQLLLNTDRTAPFAQVTLMLPLNGPDGQETASVQIQSRRGAKGELDASNCRLWFDLQMKHLGQTLVDVQVVDRIVSLKVHNAHDWAGELLENYREDISGAIESIGYQLLTLKAEPMPMKETDSESGSAANAAVSDYVPQRYRGVDFRV
ncbi:MULTISPECIES: hypothetical protein [Paenibacillus]|uniref:Uncharacterized protein n=1 Tax=Paenibacillus albilobatus TaxID=2716884 RepID=A0A919XGB4_9BACL|nr:MULTISPECIES: hypothetical protein [Paenibacillus]GIO30020.1 hypothetical protein J2TS6_11610 [Paenibacillus albilobatus]